MGTGRGEVYGVVLEIRRGVGIGLEYGLFVVSEGFVSRGGLWCWGLGGWSTGTSSIDRLVGRPSFIVEVGTVVL